MAWVYEQSVRAVIHRAAAYGATSWRTYFPIMSASTCTRRRHVSVAERGVRQRVLDERQLKNPRRGERVHGEADAVDRDGAVRHHQWLEVVGERERRRAARRRAAATRSHGADAIDVSLHDVSAEAIAEAQRALQVHAPAASQSPMVVRSSVVTTAATVNQPAP